ncbi:hypothetical protein L6452_21792 [Arctium lappa]|uniref:Uncharacterized protein n=1 Tax=Arctium lappa TaxID=4217 RepID=A0ACB9AX57_ARCLA|nr:hypothetical protein L6452_21792 [Arctium lappa]
MAGKIKVNLMVVMAIMLASIQFHGTVAQTTHVVGDAFGWNIPTAGASYYATWASRQTFTVGDVLLFNFTTGPHTVAEVAQAAYGPCTTANPISVATTGPARITLNAAGNHYYICTIGTHCQLGQKLSINVVSGASATPAPAPGTPLAPVSPPTTAATPTPSPTPSTTVSPPTSAPSPSGSSTPSPSGSSSPPSPGSGTPVPTGSATPPPPPPADSFAPSFTAAVPITFLAMTLAFFY